MKSSDLRIGNYVRIKNTSDIVCVSAITKRKIGFHAPNELPNAQLRYRKYSEIEGVLIYGLWPIIDCPNLYWRDEYDDEKWYGYYGCERPIRFIHELQNIHYALTGNEIEIEI